MEIWVGLICTVFGIVISYLTFYINQKNQIKKETIEDTERYIRVEMKLDNIYNNLGEMRLEQKDISKILSRLNGKVAFLEQSLVETKKRIDKLEKEGNKKNV